MRQQITDCTQNHAPLHGVLIPENAYAGSSDCRKELSAQGINELLLPHLCVALYIVVATQVLQVRHLPSATQI